MITKGNLNRRNFLASCGVTVLLPMLESLMPPGVLAQDAHKAKRLLVYYTSCGRVMKNWLPTKTGQGFDLPSILAPMSGFKDEFSVVSNVGHYVGKKKPGAHAVGTSGFMTGVESLSGIIAGISADQVAAKTLGASSPIRSLQLSQRLGNVAREIGPLKDSTYCDVISWADTTTPLAPQSNPRAIFDSLFAGSNSTESDKEKAIRLARKKSVLDSTLSQLQTVRNKVSKGDSYILDQYLNLTSRD